MGNVCRDFYEPMLKAVMSAKLRPAKFMSTRATSDLSWEDPLERFDGASDVAIFLGMCQYLEGLTFKVHHEVHSAHEILMDWDISVSVYNSATCLPLTLYR